MALTLIITALQIEATPWIQSFGLKKDDTSRRIPVYRAENCQLAISGVGSVPAAIATTLLLSQLDATELEQVHLFNIGLCGSPDSEQKLGTIVLGNCIQDFNTGRTFIPDILTRHIFAECKITTVAQPVTRSNLSDSMKAQTVYEMEAAGIYQAATTFLAPHQIHFLKIVSDHLEGNLLDEQTMKQLLNSSVEPVQDYINSSLSIPTTERFELNAEQSKLMDALTNQLKLTQTQSIQLKEAAMACVFRSPNDLEVRCEDFIQQHPRNKKERNEMFARLVEKLRGENL